MRGEREGVRIRWQGDRVVGMGLGGLGSGCAAKRSHYETDLT